MKGAQEEAAQTGGQNLPQVLRLMGQMLLRQERDINMWKTQDSYVIHFSRDPKGLLPILVEETTKWRTAQEQPTSGPFERH